MVHPWLTCSLHVVHPWRTHGPGVKTAVKTGVKYGIEIGVKTSVNSIKTVVKTSIKTVIKTGSKTGINLFTFLLCHRRNAFKTTRSIKKLSKNKLVMFLILNQILNGFVS